MDLDDTSPKVNGPPVYFTLKFSYFLNGIDILANNLHCAFSIAGSNKNKLQKKDQIITNIGG